MTAVAKSVMSYQVESLPGCAGHVTYVEWFDGTITAVDGLCPEDIKRSANSEKPDPVPFRGAPHHPIAPLHATSPPQPARTSAAGFFAST
ncbi:hypothetical protein FE88_07755 [Azospirillum brasilense]|uniref:hypothetical protein n=1 Tax=Azospirillum phage Cd TaxID=467481 RepID=UPI000165BD64|nr:hypothetical protein APCd_gp55 [Azospirillum phage Cd]OPH16883.1 hypothetical protein FE89_02690 [Azospirillum brasilense]OPH21564.1 hypothetical protein FE88_07755 [Azospirillum brasilense]PWC97680.1 hypothetical protein AEJ54_00875 [Azospirillum sp. Sp 7]CAO99381.1 hypothetical protein [Azospirillum phage Cd]